MSIPGCKSNIYKSRFQTGYKFVQRNRWVGVAVCQLGYLYGEEEGAWHTVGRSWGAGRRSPCLPVLTSAHCSRPGSQFSDQGVTPDGNPGGQSSPPPLDHRGVVGAQPQAPWVGKICEPGEVKGSSQGSLCLLCPAQGSTAMMSRQGSTGGKSC